MGAKESKISETTLVTKSLIAINKNRSMPVCCEVPILGRSVDLAYVHDEALITVEFKLRDWRRAIVQALDHMLGADYCYVCMPKRSVSDLMRLELEKAGVGLLFFQEDEEWPFEEVIEARRSEHTWEVARGWALEYIYENEGESYAKSTARLGRCTSC